MPFSLLMSLYRGEQITYLEEAITSAMEQTLPPEELILVGDGPLPLEMQAMVDQLCRCYPQIRFLPQKENRGLGLALAEGLRHCRNELVARMDTDDVCAPDRFAKQIAYLQAHPDCAVLGSFIDEFDETKPGQKRRKQMPLSGEELRTYARLRNPMNHMTVVFRKSHVLAAGGYRHFPYLEDYDLWSRMLARGEEMANLPQYLVHMRVKDQTYQRRGGFAYFRQYVKLRRMQHRLGLLPGKSYPKAILLTMGMTLCPSFIRRIIYQRGLRS